MRVLHVVTRMNVGGVATLVRTLAGELPAHGVEVVLAVGEVQEGEAELEGLPADVVRVVGLGRAPDPRDDVRALGSLRRLVRTVRPDVVHTHTAKAGALGRLAAEATGARRVHTFHGHLLHGYFGRRTTAAVTLAERALAARTALLISSGRGVGEQLRAAGVGRTAHWVDIPPGVVPPTPTGPREPRTVAFVGRLVGVKRPDRAVEVARLLPDVRLLVAGDGPLREELQRRSPPNVEWLGWVADVGTVYGRASAVLLCSENEAMPLALVEGALCGLPGVTTDVGSAGEVVQHERNGLVSGPEPAALAAAVARLLDDEALRQRLAAAALADARATHTVEAMTAAHAEAYATLLARRSPVGR